MGKMLCWGNNKKHSGRQLRPQFANLEFTKGVYGKPIYFGLSEKTLGGQGADRSVGILAARCLDGGGARMQNAVIELRALGPMPDSIEENPAEEVVAMFDKLLGEVQTPLTQEEAQILIHLFPKSSMYEVEWALLHLVETYLIETPSRSSEYRQLISACSSDEWRETLQVRLDRWEKKRTPSGSNS